MSSGGCATPFAHTSAPPTSTADLYAYRSADTTPIDDQHRFAYGHGSNYLAHASLPSRRWTDIFGGKEDRPAPIYILDGVSYELLSTIRPKEELGLGAVQHLHNVVWHRQGGQLYLVCQAWNPGFYFVLGQV